MKRIATLRATLLLAGIAIAITSCKKEELKSEASDFNAARSIESGITTITASMPGNEASQKLGYEYDGTNSKLNVKWSASEIFHGFVFVSTNIPDGIMWLKFNKKGSDESTSATFVPYICTKAGKDEQWQNPTLPKGAKVYAIYGKGIASHFSNTESTSLPSSISVELTGQNGSSTNLKDFDYMVANGTTTGKTNEEGNSSLNLQFEHKIAILHLKGLNIGTQPEADLSVTSVTVNGNAIGNIAYFVKDGKYNFTSTGSSIEANGITGVELPANTLVAGRPMPNRHGNITGDIYIAFFPNSEATDETRVTIVLKDKNGNTTRYFITKDVPTGGFQAGKMYKVSGSLTLDTNKPTK